jgi:hypothetical protein
VLIYLILPLYRERATLGKTPGAETWAALEAAAVRAAPDMVPQAWANALWSYATLGKMLEGKTWAALEATAGRLVLKMNSQDLSNTVFAYATLSTLRGVELPSCYAAVWDKVCGMEARDFIDEQLQILFHAHLMHGHFLSSQVAANVSTPGWLMVEARDAWMRGVRDDSTVSRSHRELAETFAELGVRHEVEHVTDDGYFSIDIYLPDHDVAVEYDGPSHYYYNDSNSSSRGGGGDDDNSPASSRRTAKTELRNLFLTERCAKVVTVPWFEFDACNDSPEKRAAYVRELLLRAVSSTSRPASPIGGVERRAIGTRRRRVGPWRGR